MDPIKENLAFQAAYNTHIRPLLQIFADMSLPTKPAEGLKEAKALAAKFARRDLREIAEQTADPTESTPAQSLAVATPDPEPSEEKVGDKPEGGF